MISNNNKFHKRPFSLSNNKYYNKLINRIIIVLIILITIFVIKMINSKTTSNIIKIIEKNINYDFSLKKDGIIVKEYFNKAIDISKETFYQFTDEVFNKTK